MLQKNRVRPALLLVFAMIALANGARTTGFDNIRAVQFLSIFAGGLCMGVALALFTSDWRSRSESDIVKK